MIQGGDESIIFWQFAFIACWILLPLVPAVMIYLIFPNTQTSLGGPFSGLTLKSSGAFSAYFVVLLASYPVWSSQAEDMRALMRPTWEITGEVKVLNERGQEIDYPVGKDSPLSISLKPELSEIDGKEFSIFVPERENSVPRIVIHYRDFGAFSIDPDRPPPGVEVAVDKSNHRIAIRSPLVIRKRACEGICGDE